MSRQTCAEPMIGPMREARSRTTSVLPPALASVANRVPTRNILKRKDIAKTPRGLDDENLSSLMMTFRRWLHSIYRGRDNASRPGRKGNSRLVQCSFKFDRLVDTGATGAVAAAAEEGPSAAARVTEA